MSNVLVVYSNEQHGADQLKADAENTRGWVCNETQIETLLERFTQLNGSQSGSGINTERK